MENRILKFRFWNVKKSRWYGDTIFEEPPCLTSYFELAIDPKQLIVNQFTGLLDKNGKEIYECDVVEFYHKGENVKCTIIFDNAAFKLKWADGYINNWKLNPEKYTVVGNVYQPELIK